MKPIKIEPKNDAAIDAALAAVNGRAFEHTFTSSTAIARQTKWLEQQLDRAALLKKERPGATACVVSGGTVASGYKYSRRATLVRFERRAAGWYLTAVEATDIYKDGGSTALNLTDAQRAAATERFLQRARKGDL